MLLSARRLARITPRHFSDWRLRQGMGQFEVARRCRRAGRYQCGFSVDDQAVAAGDGDLRHP
jgi:hypothetical protein